MSSTDYVLRVLFDRLARAFNVLQMQFSLASTGTFSLQEFDTVGDMLTNDVVSLAKCANYNAGDDTLTVWLRSTSVSPTPNGTDVLQALNGTTLLRIYVREGLGAAIVPSTVVSSYIVGQPIFAPTIEDLRAGEYSVPFVIVVTGTNGRTEFYKKSAVSGIDDNQNTIVNAIGVTYILST